MDLLDTLYRFFFLPGLKEDKYIWAPCHIVLEAIFSSTKQTMLRAITEDWKWWFEFSFDVTKQFQE